MRSTESSPRAATGTTLQVEGLDVFYGRAHALQGVSLSLGDGVLAVVGRNGMGKTSLCKAITGMVPAGGSVRFNGEELLGRSPDVITRLGVAYVPQGRRVWRSLTVDETLQLASRTARQGPWTVERVYQVFPRLAERRANGGAQLSGGEQQMLAIGRALLFNPRLIVMDEPTEGLAPVIVEQVATLLKALADERSMSVLLIEQNLGVALEVADQVAIMVNGRIAHHLPAAELASDRALQQRLLGLKAGAAAEDEVPAEAAALVGAAGATVLRVVRAHGSSTALLMLETAAPAPARAVVCPSVRPPEQAPNSDAAVYLAGAWGTQHRELSYVRHCLEQSSVRVVTVDIGGAGSTTAQVSGRELLRHHPDAARHGIATTATISLADLAVAFAAYLGARHDVAALLAVVRGDGVPVGCAGALALPLGLPKVVVSDRPLPTSDTDVFTLTGPIGELNRVSESLLSHAASAVAGMVKQSRALRTSAKPLVCITSLASTGAAVRHARRAIGDAYDCLVLDMAAGGAATLTRLAGSGLIAGVIDIAPVDLPRAVVTDKTEPCRRRLDAVRASGVPYVMATALLNGAVFPPGEPVPGGLLQRELRTTEHDGSVVPVTRDEAQRIGEWLGECLSSFPGPLRVLMPRQALAPETQALRASLGRSFKAGPNRQLVETPDAFDDMRFGEALGTALRDLIRGRLAA